MGVAPESAVLHEYRHLLRTASTDWAETAHRHALTSLGRAVRVRVLTQLRLLLQTGYRLHPDDVHALARLLVLAERRRPRTVLDGLEPDLVRHLAAAVVASPVGQMLRAGIDVWDGTEPPRPPEERPAPDRHQRWHLQRATPGYEGDLAVFRVPPPGPRRLGS